MKLTQFHNYLPVVYEITPTSLKIGSQKIFKRETEEYLFENILIKDRYEIKHHDKYAFGYVALFVALLGHFGIAEGLSWHPNYSMLNVFAVLTLISIVRVFITRTKIYIPTKDQGLIKIYKKRPSKGKVKEFLYELEGKALLVAKKASSKIDLKEFIPK